MVTESTQDSFEKDVIQADTPVLVDFWAPWCGPCKMITPHIEALASEMDGVKIVKVNIDDQPQLAQQYGIMSIPALLFFKEGKVMEQMVGVQPKESIQSKLEELK